MVESLQNLCTKLDELSAKVIAAWTENRTLTEVHGWSHPAITKHDLALLPKRLADKIREVDPENIDAELDNLIKDLPRRIKLLYPHTIPHMFNGHGAQAIPAYNETLKYIEVLLSPLLGWEVLQDTKAMPVALSKRLRSIQSDMNEIAPNIQDLREQIQLIKDAHSTAESLPTDLESLKEVRKKIDAIATDSSKSFEQIASYLKKIAEAEKSISEGKNITDKLVEKCEEAYRITTTKGLAGAFDQRASRLNQSMWIWVVGLLSALIIGAWVGTNRLDVLSKLDPKTEFPILMMHIILSVLSIGAPLWFSWLATKQIGQRFRLSEDYAFKASVAKAYEGYLREAESLDEKFEFRLFEAALTRLEEPPLRLIENFTHGSPYQDFLSSEQFQNAWKTIPGFKDKVMELAKDAIAKKSSNKKEEA
jgi:hypothetical protein